MSIEEQILQIRRVDEESKLMKIAILSEYFLEYFQKYFEENKKKIRKGLIKHNEKYVDQQFRVYILQDWFGIFIPDWLKKLKEFKLDRKDTFRELVRMNQKVFNKCLGLSSKTKWFTLVDKHNESYYIFVKLNV